MFSRIRKPLTWANVAMTLALVFAMTGGAYAAKKYLITSTKQISPKVLKQLQGKTGPAGPQGLAGPAGAAGKEGLAGKEGKQGLEGKEGKEGKQGIQGIEGKPGKEGEPWTAGGTLPKGKTETGTWALDSPAEGLTFGSISFPIPLANPLGASHVFFLPPEFPTSKSSECAAKTEPEKHECEEQLKKEEEACPGTVAEPKAAEGDLCVYVQEKSTMSLWPFGAIYDPSKKAAEEHSAGAGATGATLLLVASEAAQAAFGTWAVTSSE